MKEKKKKTHRGVISQTFIYLGKFFRMFIFQNDWKVLPMSAIIAGVVSAVVGKNIFFTMEGTKLGTFALSCVCIWNGFFNSIQVICRERAIVKREHRAGVSTTSYLLAHMIYQAFLCMCQSIILVGVCMAVKTRFPAHTLITPWPQVDMMLSIFLTTYAADVMALMISALVKSTTMAMTVMPFLLIFQLVFSGSFFELPAAAMKVTDFTISKWGLSAMSIQGEYNEKPMVSLWNAVVKMKNVEFNGQKPVQQVLEFVENSGARDGFLLSCARQNQNPDYDFKLDSLLKCWFALFMFIVVCALVAKFALDLIDKDNR